jgi:putative membrane protein
VYVGKQLIGGGLKMKLLGFLLALATAFTIACNDRSTTYREDSAVGTSGAADTISSADKDFIHDLSIAGKAEVELGKMAMDNSANADVKKFAQMMIEDHTKAAEKLGAVASQHNIPKPVLLDEKHTELRDKLSKLKGPEFDREYMDAMVAGHEGVLDKVESRVDKTGTAEWRKELAAWIAGKKGRNPEELPAVVAETSSDPATMSINQWAASAYPTVYSHLIAAKNLEDAVDKRAARSQ